VPCEIVFDRSFEIEQIVLAEKSKGICSLKAFVGSAGCSRSRVVNPVKSGGNIGTCIAFHVVSLGDNGCTVTGKISGAQAVSERGSRPTPPINAAQDFDGIEQLSNM
jgi:hypothetical protein